MRPATVRRFGERFAVCGLRWAALTPGYGMAETCLFASCDCVAPPVMLRVLPSSLTSIGLPSQWVHGTEWAHGELGGVGGGDVITMVSHSGKTSELLDLANELQGSSHLAGADDTSAITFVALTGDANSALAQLACVPLTCAVPDDAELLGVLPTASVLSAHHVFNAVLTECAARLELTPETIARHHPGGSIGRALR